MMRSSVKMQQKLVKKKKSLIKEKSVRDLNTTTLIPWTLRLEPSGGGSTQLVERRKRREGMNERMGKRADTSHGP